MKEMKKEISYQGTKAQKEMEHGNHFCLIPFNGLSWPEGLLSSCPGGKNRRLK